MERLDKIINHLNTLPTLTLKSNNIKNEENDNDLKDNNNNDKRENIPNNKKVVLIAGVGDGLGLALAKEFASHDYIIVILRRNGDLLPELINKIKLSLKNNNNNIYGYGCDLRKENDIKNLINNIENNIGIIDCAIFNPGANVYFPFLETTSRVYYKIWEMCCHAGFLFSKEIVPYMLKRGYGTIIFTGATSSIRSSIGHSAFAGGKHALRSLASSIAKEYGPKGLHISHVIIDGPIDTQFINNNFINLDKNRLIKPDDISKIYYFLHTQPKSAWTFELDCRSYCEPWSW